MGFGPGVILLVFFSKLVGRFGYFLFFCSGEGKGESGATGRGRGSVSLLKIPGEGRGLPGGGGRARGSGGCLLGIGGGGGQNIFFSGSKCPPSKFRVFPRDGAHRIPSRRCREGNEKILMSSSV